MKKHTLETSLLLILLIIMLFAVYGCGGTRNTDTSKTERTDNRINIENSYSLGSKIVMANNYTFRPFDNSKPYFVNGQKYENVDIAVNKDITAEKYFKVKEKTIVHTSREIIKNKITDKTNYIYLWLGMFLIVVIAVWLWLYFKNYRLQT